MKRKEPANVISFPGRDDYSDWIKLLTARQKRELRALSMTTGASIELLIEKACLEFLAKIEVAELLIGILAEISKHAIGARKAAIDDWSRRLRNDLRAA